MAEPQVENVATLPDVATMDQVRRAHRGRQVGTAILMLVLLAAASSYLGVRTQTRTATSDGVHLEVDAPLVLRAGLAPALNVRVTDPAGEGPIRIAISRGLFDILDFQNAYPVPAAETGTVDEVIYEFDRPPGATLSVHWDMRAGPYLNGSFHRFGVRVVHGTDPPDVSFPLLVVP